MRAPDHVAALRTWCCASGKHAGRRRDRETVRMLWLKAFHVISVVSWFAALLYLPRLFVYHSQIQGDGSIDDDAPAMRASRSWSASCF